VIEIVVESIVESLDILERGNDLLQIVVLKSRVNDKLAMDSHPQRWWGIELTCSLPKIG
jgi:hypothetical protein